MSKQITAALGLSDEEPGDFGTEEYLLPEDDLDIPDDNPLFATNTELDLPVDPGEERDVEAENPLMDNFPDQNDFPDQEFDGIQEIDTGLDDEGSGGDNLTEFVPDADESPTDDAREALTAQFLDNADRRLRNSIEFQDRALVLNESLEGNDDGKL